jgi:thiol-disulfide isomerase/thioredoxin
MKLTFPYLTLDWVSRWRAKANPDIIATLEAMKAKAPEKNKPYYDNTIAFVKFAELDDLEVRGQFLRATTYRVLNLARIKLDAMPPRPVVLKVIGEIPHCGFVLKLPPEMSEASKELRNLFEKEILLVKRLDYPKFIESLPDTPGTAFNLAASGVVLSVEKKDVEFLDVFNLDPNAPPAEKGMNLEIVK